MRRAGGWALVGAALMVVVGMAHHPRGFGSGMGEMVHGFMILAVLVTAFGFAGHVLDRGIERPAVMAGAIAYAVALFAGICAASINGFVMAALHRGADPVGLDVTRLAWAANQSLAGLGVIATAAAYLCWAADLLRGPDTAARAAGAAGIAAALAPAALLGAGVLRLDLAGATLLYAVQALWAALVGLRLLAQRAAAS